jgi:chromosome partitioning protein
VLALPAIVLRNDQQDALGVGLGVIEYAPRGKSAEEIRGLWQWVWARLNPVLQPDADLCPAIPLPDVSATLHVG